MDSDQFLVIGIILVGLSIPSLLQAASESRFPRAGATMALAGAILIAYASANKATGYALPEIPTVFMKVIRSWIS
jgi:hypothetical protein